MDPNSRRHLYPLKIALRAQRLIQGSLFYDVLVDTAAGQYVRLVPDAEKSIKNILINKDGWNEETYKTSWECFDYYIKEFQNPIYQHAVYSMISHWDWFISNLGKFIYFAEKSRSPEKQVTKDLLRINFKPFTDQIKIVNRETGISYIIDGDTLNLIKELHLVRNLGMHSQWEIDEIYLRETITNGLVVGQKREFDIQELTKWHTALLQIIDVLASTVAVHYANVPPYDRYS